MPKVTETLTCEENRIEPIQGMSEEESEGQQNNTTNSEKSNSDADLEEIKLLLENRMKGEISTDNVASSDVINRFSESLQNKIKDLSESRTAKLWLQYLENDRYSAFFHQSRKNRTLAAASQKLQRNASIFGCFRTQLVH